jgi:5-methylcytosine-specific restriction endonuclease McrA
VANIRTIRLIEARKKGTHTKKQWHEMKLYFGHCVRCGVCGVELVKDHIVPIYQGGSDSIKNLQPLCRKCNSSKGPEDIDFRVLFCDNRNIYMPKDWL